MKCSSAVIGYALGIAISACLLDIAQAQEATASMRRNIADLTDEAAAIVHGTVVTAVVEPDPNFSNLTTVLVTLNVEDMLKGSADKTYTFRQFVWDIRARSNSAGYAKGEELLLFIRPPSRYGLTSPAGLQQGRFLVQRDSKGRVVAINGQGNAGLQTFTCSSPRLQPGWAYCERAEAIFTQRTSPSSHGVTLLSARHASSSACDLK